MRKVLFMISILGVLAGGLVAYLSGITQPPLPPAFTPATSPYAKAIYAEGIIESDQPNGENINVYPEVSGTVKQIFVSEGQEIKRGTLLLAIDDSIQRATTEQLDSQAQAAFTLLRELKAQPRKETLDVAEAQVAAAKAMLKTAQDALDKQQTAFDLDPKSVSKDALDSARNAAVTAQANLAVAERQRDLTKAGAWVYDIDTQEKQYNALTKSYLSAKALLSKYSLRAPSDGKVLAINSTVGGFVSAQGAYESYTQAMTPALVLGSPETRLNVRCYIDEILVPRLCQGSQMKAQMSLRGSNVKLDLQFVRVQPIVSPKIELSNQRQERVDVRVLPIIFRIDKPKGVNLYPGQLVDVYISE